MRVLWLSNLKLSEVESGRTGTWLQALADQLTATGRVHLTNVTSADGDVARREDYGTIEQWLVPRSKPNANGLPAAAVTSAVLRIVEQARPDVVHVWGTESYWGLLTARKLIQKPAMLETQGLKFAIARHYTGNLSAREQLACIGLKEILRRTTIPQMRASFERWGEREQEIIRGHDHITVQTDWLEAQVRQHNVRASVYRNDFLLRAPFYDGKPWRRRAEQSIFCSAAYSAPFKGLHVAIRALALLRQRHPAAQLRVAGAHVVRGLRRDGYMHWVTREAQRHSASDAVRWLGPLGATAIVEELRRCSLFLMPSFVEGYCLGLAEAMYLGVPSVVAYSGGAACLADSERSALFFTPGDEAMCAWQMGRVLDERGLDERLSGTARNVGIARNDRPAIVGRYIETYQQVATGGRGE